jgi:hypothetical protein
VPFTQHARVGPQNGGKSHRSRDNTNRPTTCNKNNMTMTASGLLTILCLASASAFSPPAASNSYQRTPTTTTSLCAVVPRNEDCYSRSAFLSSAFGVVAVATSAFVFPSVAIAADESSNVNRSIRACELNDDCVSTANIRDAKGSYR